MKNHEQTDGWLILWGMICAFCILISGLAQCTNAYGQTNAVRAGWDAVSAPDLAGYKLHWGESSGGYSQSYTIPVADFVPNPAYNDIPTGWLTAGTWYFAATAFDEAGNESGYSNEVVVNVPDVAPGTPQTIEMQITLPDGTLINFSVTQ